MATTPTSLRAGNSASIQWDGTQFASTNVMAITAVSDGASTGLFSRKLENFTLFKRSIIATIGSVSASAGTFTWSVPINIDTSNPWTIQLQASRDGTSGAPSYTHSSGSFPILGSY